jgi:hypothetical protein
MARHGVSTGATIRGRADALTRFSLSLLALVALGGCGGLRLGPEPVRDPLVVGVVEGWDRVGSSTDRFHLSDGRELEIDYNDSRQLFPGDTLDAGDLLLYGTDSEGAWYQVLDREADCYILESRGSDAGNFIVFDVGFRLPKAPDFDAGGVTSGEFRANPGIPFCVDAEGRVVSYGR